MSKKKFTIQRAKYISFCGGVRWAVSEVLKLREESGEQIAIFGELIHNKQFNDYLESKNIEIAEFMEDCKDKIAVIRSHGLPPIQEEKLRALAKEVVDLTCPKVKKIQSLAHDYSEKGFLVVIAGNPKHPEVIGIRGYTKKSEVISSIEDAEKVNLNEKTILISQTTFSHEKFIEMSDILKKRKPGIEIQNTLCGATKGRQKEVVELAKNNDLLIVIGGKHSSNTRKLYETAKRNTNHPVLQIETQEELKDFDFSGIKKIGISSGASTPDWMIDRVEDYLNNQVK